ncbi:4-hydroxythreonine-4-phosphate dehydrogenase PdxA [Hydrogenophaga sp.]|uniref:4-hydroxythreonine-4-phosphate dehydrogenase PdxA n=1 Tax=Hydrogenophaga sp. TaxID=1904254 RepID=UPI0025B86DB9|nr:4-hydroxythreonine-4-phosphate dehydrogenase PdxA [Hydrogenophaga sp.]
MLPLVVTMGDPAGIGPEIVLRALQTRPELLKRLVVVGDLATLRRAAGWVGLDPSLLVPIAGGGLAQALANALPGRVTVVPCSTMLEPAPLGQVSALAGQAAADCIQLGARAVLSGQAAALVTAPIHKESLAAAGVPHPGHTEMLQALAAEFQGLPVAHMPVRMMLSAPRLHTVLVSIHVALRDAIEAVTTERVLETIRITARHFERCGLPQARIAVAGLNPHAGEGGLFGYEEIDAIAPAVALAQAEGLMASGPHAPDTVFMRARQGAFDVVVAMYHDQGLIPVKLLGLEHGVNTTLGLPLIRTSPDHGTAFDLAGTGRAGEESLLAAIDAAIQMADRSLSTAQ